MTDSEQALIDTAAKLAALGTADCAIVTVILDGAECHTTGNASPAELLSAILGIAHVGQQQFGQCGCEDCRLIAPILAKIEALIEHEWGRGETRQ